MTHQDVADLSAEESSKITQEKENEAQPLGFAWKEDAQVVLTGKEFSVINSLIENVYIVKNLINQRHINNGVFKAFFKEDLKEDGSLKDEFFPESKQEVKEKVKEEFKKKTKKKKVS